MTIKSIAIQLEKKNITEKEAKTSLQKIVPQHLTNAYYIQDNPNKMRYDGEPENSLTVLDKLPVEQRIISMETWRKMREIIKEIQNN